MTALCGGATSSVKPGSPVLVNVGLGLITAGLAEFAPYLLPIAILVDAFVWNANTNCTSDPPAMPTFTAEDLEVVTLGLLSGHAGQTIQKIQDLTTNIVWRQTCQCDSGPAPGPLPPPARTDSSGGSYVSEPASCFTAGWAGIPKWADGLPYNQLTNITPQFLPTTGDAISLAGVPGGNVQAYPISSQVHTLNFTGQNAMFPSDSYIYDPGVWFTFWDANHVVTDQFSFQQSVAGGVPGNTKKSVTLSKQPSFGFVGSGYNAPYTAGQTPTPLVINETITCGWAATGPESCCPPDPSIMFALNQLIQMVSNLHLTSAAQPPYVDGTRHAGLSGAGTIAIAPSSRAIRVEVHSDLTYWPHNPGDPNYFFSLGFITPFAVGTPLKGQRLVYGGQTFTWPSYTDQIGYTLTSGVIVDLVELE